MIRLICSGANEYSCAITGLQNHVTMTFDVDLPAVEEFLKVHPDSYEKRSIIGFEILPEKPQA